MTTNKTLTTNNKLKREPYLRRTENHIFALQSSTNTKQKFRFGTKNRVGRVCGNKQLFYALIVTPVWEKSSVKTTVILECK